MKSEIHEPNEKTNKIVSKTKFTILIAACLFVTAATQAQGFAANRFNGDIHHDRVDVRHDLNDMRHDRADLRYDRRMGDRRDFFHDRQDLRVDHRDFDRDRYELRRDIRDNRCW